MDIRTILAVIIIGLIILLTPMYQRLFYKGKTLVPKEKRPSPAETTRVDTGGLGKVPLGSAEGRDIVVETPLYVAELNTEGAMLESWRLKKFPDRKGRPLELLKGRSGPALTLEGVSLDSVEFSYGGKDSVVVMEGEREVVMRAVVGDIDVEKRFVFRSDGYTVGFKVMAYSPKEPIKGEVSWLRGIAVTESNVFPHCEGTRLVVTIVVLTSALLEMI